jgi:hypothetical protein
VACKTETRYTRLTCRTSSFKNKLRPAFCFWGNKGTYNY